MIPFFLTRNITPDAVSITADNSTVENIKTDVPAETYKSDSTTCQVDIVFSTPVNIKGVAIVNHNCTGIEMRCSVDSFDNFQTYTFIPHDGIMIKIEAIEASHFRFILSSTNPVEVGQVYLSAERITLPNRIQYPIQSAAVRDVTVFRTETGQRIPKTNAKYWQFTFNLRGVTETDYLDIIDSLYSDKAILLVIDEAQQKALQGAITNTISGTLNITGYDFQLCFEQNTFPGALKCYR